eukprot:CAMPEP_0204906612 /NCGR_PEP_ID=MMETSP1397-20131031/6065_1 /ASSEMBLY_ACC=CAM_ASM_000891 /TAXON_ID=49980 /ORGANISM="Climacostomum Climacostomum virens, Strain Stock W-24" /LENGTH=431 /DNA_ID=CAMNT_0052075613 /DNA_START=904 /DNA_END=2196 /DNA_ORIENTATION=+
MADRRRMLLTDLACSLSKEGISLLRIAQALDVEPDTVLNLIAIRTQLDMFIVKAIFNSMELGLSINKMPTSIPKEVLKIFVPVAPQTELSRNYKAEIRRCYGEGLLVHQIVDYLGVSETEVMRVLDDEASVADSQPSTVVSELPLRMPKAPEESKSPAVRTAIPKRRKEEERIEPPKKIVEETPQYIYSYDWGSVSNSLFRTTLSTGEIRKEKLRNHNISRYCVWCEVAGGDIYFTGGQAHGNSLSNEVVRVSASSLEVTQKAGMLSERLGHGSVYYKDYLYAIGGYNGGEMRECERLSVSEDRWEALPPLPEGCCNRNVVVVKDTECLYFLGKDKLFDGSEYFGVIQRFSLGWLEWDVIPLRIRINASNIACFSKESELWFVVRGTLYCFNAITESLSLIKYVGEIESHHGPSYYHRGYLYCSSVGEAAK